MKETMDILSTTEKRTVIFTLYQKSLIFLSLVSGMTHTAFRTFRSGKADPLLSLSLFEREPKDVYEMAASGIHPIETFALPIETLQPTKLVDPILSFTISYKGNVEELANNFPDMKIHTKAGNYATAEAPASTVKELLGSERVRYIEASMPLQVELDRSTVEVRTDRVRQQLGLTGKNVIVGIIDSGIDYTHPDFRNADGTSRIQYIWDQNESETSTTGRTPAPFLYGKEYSKNEIDIALSSRSPHSVVPQRDENGHGTHVAGIAVGNGAASSGRYIGMAPGADIIFVKYWSIGSLADSNTLIDALEYIFRKADELGTPAVVNISLGNQLGPHDGTSQFELFIDKLLIEKQGRVVVKSAGNDGDSFLHTQGQVSNGGTASLRFSISGDDDDDDLISIWYETKDRLAIRLTSPTGELTPIVEVDGDPISHQLPNRNIVEIVHKSRDKEDQTVNSIVIAIKRGSAQIIEEGIWSIEVIGRQVADGKFDSWIERIASRNRMPPMFIGENSNAKTISLPGTSRTIITVGNYASGADIAKASSRGPTRDGRLKPDIACPGTRITSSLSKDSGRSSTNAPGYVTLSGTSMAAPTATGIIALMLEKQRSLSAAMIKKIICDTTRSDEYTGNELPNNSWGFGKMDAWSALYVLPYNELIDIQLTAPGSDLSLITEISSGCESRKIPHLSQFAAKMTRGKMILFVSPDSTFQAVQELLDEVGRGDELFISIYDFSVEYVADLVESTVQRGAKVKLMIDKDRRSGSVKSEEAIIEDLVSLGADFVWAPSCNNQNINMFTNCHQKVVIVSRFADSSVHPKKVMISSGNWSSGGIPHNLWEKTSANTYENPRSPQNGRFKNGNREWGIIIEDEEMAQEYYNLLQKDFDEAKNAKIAGVPEFVSEAIAIKDPYLLEDLYEEEIVEEIPIKPHPPLTMEMTNFKLTPLMSPDNYQEVVTRLIHGATKSIKIQQQTISPNGRYGVVRSLVDSLIDAKRNNLNLTIQFLRSSRFLNQSSKNALEEMARAGIQIKYHNTRQLSHIHNKGMIVDDEYVVITSTNFTDTSIKENRECGILVQDKNVAKYYDEVFKLDWSKGLDEPGQPSRIITESDPRLKSNPGAYRRISLADLIDSVHQ